MSWYLGVLKKYAVFSGRARRKEYWMFLLFHVLIVIVLSLIDGAAGLYSVLVGLYSLAVLIPELAVSVRRLHDTGHSGWWLLIGLVPLVGAIWLLIFMLQDGQPGENQYGSNPKEGPALAGEAAAA